MNIYDIEARIFDVKTGKEFNDIAVEVFRYQYNNVPVYGEYVDLLGVKPGNVDHYTKIPFLPIQFFKSHDIISEGKSPEAVFLSSGTTGTERSRHPVADLQLYEKSFFKGFEYFYGSPSKYIIIALLPSYLEQGNSSLVYMAGKLIEASGREESGFFLNNYEELAGLIERSEKEELFLLGVSYALLDLGEKYPVDMKGAVIMETGGMKGRRKELVREELHTKLRGCFNVNKIHSEYGMTELFSQAYSGGDGVFRCPPWMKVVIRDTDDPLTLTGNNKTGGINVIDLANIHSCSFIATQDLGKSYDNGTFEVLGRFDNSDIRGCNLMVE